MDNSVSASILNNSQTIISFFHELPWLAMLLMFIFGSMIGSFLNVLALRSLKDESIVFPASYCPNCKHTLAAADNIPILSFLVLRGRCRYCKAAISWQYPTVEFCTGLIYAAITYVFLASKIHLSGDYDPIIPAGDFTKDLFRAIQHGRTLLNGQTLDSFTFQYFGLAAGMLVFASTLIAVTVTDFREKLIPHEITYPSMIFGIAFSTFVRGDLLGSMAGIGASYIIFDFLAFYGLKLYIITHPELLKKDDDSSDKNTKIGETATVSKNKIENSNESLQAGGSIEPESIEKTESHCSSVPEELSRQELPQQDKAEINDFRSEVEIKEKQIQKETAEENDEPLEVMGGGDAVLSAVMSAYLGWQGLILALLIGFITGTLMGLGLLINEMKKAGLLGECGRKSFLFALCGGLIMGALSLLMLSGLAADYSYLTKTVLSTAAVGMLSGGLLGMVSVGTRVSKPFPFGPALALGGFVSMFLIPFWLPFY